MKLQKNTRLALYSVLEFAARPDEHVPASEVAQSYGESVHHLAKVLSELAHAGIDPRKRAMLISSGADLIVADFGEHAGLTDYLRLSAGAGRQ